MTPNFYSEYVYCKLNEKFDYFYIDLITRLPISGSDWFKNQSIIYFNSPGLFLMCRIQIWELKIEANLKIKSLHVFYTVKQ